MGFTDANNARTWVEIRRHDHAHDDLLILRENECATSTSRTHACGALSVSIHALELFWGSIEGACRGHHMREFESVGLLTAYPGVCVAGRPYKMHGPHTFP